MDGTDGALERVVARLDPAVTGAAWVPALCGLAAEEMADLAQLTVAHSHEAQVFLELMAGTVRDLQSTTTMHTERCVGHVRGPILWSETITAWSSGVGSDDVFICIAPTRDHDVAENRVVAWLLRRLATAARSLDTAASMHFDDVARAEIAQSAATARRWLGHRHLSGVEQTRPRPADLRKARATRHRGPYEPAFALADRVDRPFVPDEVEDLLDPAGRVRVAALGWVIDAVEAAGLSVPPLGAVGRAVGAGRLLFRHPRHFPAEMAGIELAGVLIDAVAADDPAAVARAEARLESRAGGRPACLVRGPEDARAAVELALRLDGRVAAAST